MAGQGQSHSDLVFSYQGEERLKTRECGTLPVTFPKAIGTRIQVPFWVGLPATLLGLLTWPEEWARIYVMGTDESLVALVLSLGVQ